MRRRRFLAAFGGALAIAGCTGRDGPGTSDGSPTRPVTASPTRSPTDGRQSPPSSPDGRPTATPRDPTPVPGSGSWPQYGSDAAHDGVTDARGVPKAATPGWQLRRIRSGPAVLADGRLFHTAKLGENPGGPPTITRTRATRAGTAHPVFGAWHLVARNAEDGRIQWTVPLGGPAAGWPAVADDTVVVGADGRIAAFGAGDGRPRWDDDLGDRPVGSPTATDGSVLVPVQGVVEGGSGEVIEKPAIRSYAVRDGTRRSSFEPPKRSNALAVSGDALVVLSGDYGESGVLRSRSLDDGTNRWRIDVPGGFFEGPIVADGTVYLGSDRGTVSAISIATGAERWHRTLDGRPSGIAAGAGSVYVGTPDGLVALHSGDGSTEWTVSGTDSETYFETPAVGDGTVYAGTVGTDGHLYAVDSETGDERWSHGFPTTIVEGDMVVSGLEAQPTVGDRAVYAYAADGLYAFGPGE